MNSAVRRKTDKWSRSLIGLGEIDIDIGSVLENQYPFFLGYLDNFTTSLLAEREARGIMAIGSCVVKGHEIAVSSGCLDLFLKAFHDWAI